MSSSRSARGGRGLCHEQHERQTSDAKKSKNAFNSTTVDGQGKRVFFVCLHDCGRNQDMGPGRSTFRKVVLKTLDFNQCHKKQEW